MFHGNIIIDSALCAGEDFIITAINNETNLPPAEIGIQAVNQIGPYQPLHLSAGDYMIFIQESDHCIDSFFIQLEEVERIQIELMPHHSLLIGDSVWLSPIINIPLSEINSVQWTPELGLSHPNLLNTVARPIKDQEYTIHVLSNDGCLGQATTFIQLNPIRIYIPNACSPNNDGINDKFLVFNIEQIKEIESMQIFNRWGDRVWSRTNFDPRDENQFWDGQFRKKNIKSRSICISNLHIISKWHQTIICR